MNVLANLCGIVLTLVALTGHSYADAAVEPKGYGAAEFGMSVAVVTKAYPALTKLSAMDPSSSGSLVLSEYQLPGQPLGDVGNCNSQFSFAQDRLYKVQLFCGDKAKTEAYLRRTYGSPIVLDDGSLQWGKKTLIIYAGKSGVVAFLDAKLHDAVQGQLLRYVMEAQGGKLPTGPGAAPAQGQP